MPKRIQRGLLLSMVNGVLLSTLFCLGPSTACAGEEGKGLATLKNVVKNTVKAVTEGQSQGKVKATKDQAENGFAYDAPLPGAVRADSYYDDAEYGWLGKWTSADASMAGKVCIEFSPAQKDVMPCKVSFPESPGAAEITGTAARKGNEADFISKDPACTLHFKVENALLTVITPDGSAIAKRATGPVGGRYKKAAEEEKLSQRPAETPSPQSSTPAVDPMNFAGIAFSDNLQVMCAKLDKLHMFAENSKPSEDTWPLRYFADGNFTEADTIPCAVVRCAATDAARSDESHMADAFTFFIDQDSRVFAYAISVARGKEVLTLQALIEKYGQPNAELTDNCIVPVQPGVVTLKRLRWHGQRNGILFMEGFGSMSDTRVVYFDQEYLRPRLQDVTVREQKAKESTGRQKALF